jgi:hypothetical protein
MVVDRRRCIRKGKALRVSEDDPLQKQFPGLERRTSARIRTDKTKKKKDNV